MSAFTETDEIRAHGMRVALGSCEGCKKAKDMDDLNQIALDRLDESVQKLIYRAKRSEESRDLWRIACFGLAVVAFLLLLGDLGVFKP